MQRSRTLIVICRLGAKELPMVKTLTNVLLAATLLAFLAQAYFLYQVVDRYDRTVEATDKALVKVNETLTKMESKAEILKKGWKLGKD